jgi:hypothetical protein
MRMGPEHCQKIEKFAPERTGKSIGPLFVERTGVVEQVVKGGKLEGGEAKGKKRKPKKMKERAVTGA